MELLVTKRNGEPVDYDENKIVIAIAKAGKATKEFDKTDKTAGATVGAPILTGSGVATNTLDL